MPEAPEHAPAPTPPRPAIHPTVPWERVAIAAALFVYVLYQVNAILHHGSYGQDFSTHLTFTARAYIDPWRFWTTYTERQNNPPLFHLLCAAAFKLTKHIHTLEVISLLTTAMNGGALLLLHRLSLRMIASPVIRVAAVVFLTFLPAGMIHAVVLAADGVTTPTVVALMYVLVRLAEAGRRTWREFLPWCVLALAAIAFAESVKFTAVALVPAAAAVIVAIWLARSAGPARTAAALLIVVAPAALLGASTYRHYKTFQQGNLGVDMGLDPFSPTTELNLRSLLFPRAADYKLLRDAPRYDAPSEILQADGTPLYDMAVPNRYSYIALLHLGVFTDIMNIYQYDRRDLYVGHRTTGQHQRMAIAVKTAVPFTLCALVAVPWMLVRSGWRVARRREDAAVTALPVFTVLTVSFAFWLVIVIFLPFTWALGGGYWLPRLIIPALFGFFLVTFAFLDRLVGHTRTGNAACLAAVIIQSILSLSFLWPWGINGPEHAPLPAMIPSDLAVHAELDVRFTPRPKDTADPLLTIGHTGVAQFVFARHDDAGNVRIGFNRFGNSEVPLSDPLPADPDRTYHIAIDTDPDSHTLAITVDGREALRVNDWKPIPVFRDEVFPLANPAGGVVSAEKFSGVEVAKTVRVRGGEPWGRGTGK